MHESFDTALSFVLQHEGGYVNDPKDPGGCTNMGITIGTYRRFLNSRGSCRDLRTMGKEAAATIYEQVYWSAVKGDALPAGVDLLVFDHGVNAGPKRAIKILQRCVGAYPDGVIGQVTLREVDRADPLKLVQKYSNRRLWYYQSLRLWSRYGRGWGRRVKEARTEAHLLAERAVFEELEWEREAA